MLSCPPRFTRKENVVIRRLVPIAIALGALWIPASASRVTAAGAGREAEGSTGGSGVDSVAMVVEDLDRSVAFFRDVLTFEQVSDQEITGEDYERLEGVFGLRLRIARMKLGDEYLDLMDFIAPEGRPVPVDSRSDDHW